MLLKSIHVRTKKSKTFSLLIIPHTKKIKQLSIATWIPKFILSFLFIFLFTSGYFIFNLYNDYGNLKQEYYEKVQKLDALEELNYHQKNEIDNLRTGTLEIMEKLKSINALQETVKDLVGLEQNPEEIEDEQIENSTVFPSRGGAMLRDSNITNFNDKDLETQVKELSLQLDNSLNELSILIEDVEEKLKYLDAKPNLMPTTGRITSGFGNRKNPFGSGIEFHNGLDIANNSGTEVKAAGSGIVTFAGYNSGYGRFIIISHGYGYQSIYGHNRKLLVDVGDKVEKGQVIAEMGSTGRSTGPHLHFEVRLNGEPIDPTKVIDNLD